MKRPSQIFTGIENALVAYGTIAFARWLKFIGGMGLLYISISLSVKINIELFVPKINHILLPLLLLRVSVLILGNETNN